MTNKFRDNKPSPPQELPGPKYMGSLDMNQGLVRNFHARKIELSATPDMSNLRFERNGIRKDFGDRALGANASNPILCIVEHKFIDAEGDQYQRLIRLLRAPDNRPKTEIWNSVAEEWQDDAITTTQTLPTTNDFVRAVSVRGVLLFACKGSPILERTEAIIYSAEYDDYPTLNDLTIAGDYTEVTLTPSGKVKQGIYDTYYDVQLNLISGAQLAVTVGLYIDGILEQAEVYSQLAPGLTDFLDESFHFINEDDLTGKKIKLQIQSISVGAGLTPRDANFSTPGGTPLYQATKTETPEAYNDQYVYRFDVDYPEEETGDLVVELFYDDGGGWTKYNEHTYSPGYSNEEEEIVVLDGMGANSKFGIHADAAEEEWYTGLDVTWDESAASYTVHVHGHHKDAPDLDTYGGVQYEAATGQTVTLDPITDAPEATWIESFGDRIVALQDGGDTQKLSASSDGTTDDWVGGDSMENVLVDTRNDPIDDLQCAGPLASNLLAIIRSRSIMKGWETGNYDISIGAVHWIENVGTESPHSISITPAGLMFLGHDYMVYLITEGGLSPVGQAIQQDLIESLVDKLHRVDGIYDAVYKEYWLGIPEGDGQDFITSTYVFDVGAFMSTGFEARRWRKRVQNVQRYAVVSGLI